MSMSRACILTLFAIAAGIGSHAYAGDIAEPPGNAATSSDPLTDAQIERITKGYSRARRSDYYCRVETPMGTRLGTKVCYTLDQLWAMDRARADDRRKLEQIQKQRRLESN